MRLNCPNCGAQYEVPDDVIPKAGRDVECSNCGNTWFQVHPDEDVELATEVGGSIPDDGWVPDAGQDEHVADTDDGSDEGDQFEDGLDEIVAAGHAATFSRSEYPEPQAAPPQVADDHGQEADADDVDTDEDHQSEERLPEDHWPEDRSEDPAPETSDDDHWPEDDAAPDEPDHDDDRDDWNDGTGEDEDKELSDAPAAQPRRRSLDPAIAELLRQEAQHEAEARKAESSDLETQPDLGLEGGIAAAAAPHSRETRVAQLRGQEGEAQSSARPNTASGARSETRRELLPDIEDINATLRSAEDRQPEERVGVGPSNMEKRRRGFRLGFGLVFLTAALGLLVYLYHARISAQVPQAAPYVEAYMAWINDTRLWLDSKVTEMMLYLDNMANQEPPADS
ncbi:zinc-ribbon domain-containing protein [Shimia biformata]|uniref:zinc-ribbon domain-containing protein n=1 Tax=Shimia biformata TaxID=1294299 RepID=UPI00194E9B77|nr:zinc-ribbon domain-containing protein [Shimia biformata]